MEYSALAKLYYELEKTSSRLDKVDMISDFLSGLSDEDIKMSIPLLQGRVFPKWSDKDIGLAARTAAKIISLSSGISDSEIMREFSSSGDYGLVAEKFIGKKKQSTLFSRSLTLDKVFSNFTRLAEIEGTGSSGVKMRLIAELVSSASPIEAKYIIRTITEELRIGVAEGVIRDSIARSWFSDIQWTSNPVKKERLTDILRKASGKRILFDTGAKEALSGAKGLNEDNMRHLEDNNDLTEEIMDDFDENMLWKNQGNIDIIITTDEKKGNELSKKIAGYIEWAWFLRPDYSKVAIIAKNKGIEGLKNAKIERGIPIQVLLAEKAPSLEAALNEYENCAIEIKYDGMRMQIHKDGDDVVLFTRRLENVTDMFPDVVEIVKEGIKADNCVLEGEVVATDPVTGKPAAFQRLSQRIHRKYDIHRMSKEIPVELNLFDAVYINGDMLFHEKFSVRRSKLSDITDVKRGQLVLAEQLVTKNPEKANEFYNMALSLGQEGIMVKNLDSFYQPGKRVSGGWLKVKPIMETLDLVITGAVWGTGKRAGGFGSFLLSCSDSEGNFLECGMLGTGIKEKKTKEDDVTFMELTDMIKDNILSEKDNAVSVKPKIIIEVAYEEIQKSINYNSGFALRFPRLVRIRDDKSVDDCDNIGRIRALFLQQRGRNSDDNTE